MTQTMAGVMKAVNLTMQALEEINAAEQQAKDQITSYFNRSRDVHKVAQTEIIKPFLPQIEQLLGKGKLTVDGARLVPGGIMCTVIYTDTGQGHTFIPWESLTMPSET